MNQRVLVIRVKGEMSPQLRASFEDVEITIDRGVTQLTIVCSDASALHGMLDRIEAFGLELLDVRPLDQRSPT